MKVSDHNEKRMTSLNCLYSEKMQFILTIMTYNRICALKNNVQPFVTVGIFSVPKNIYGCLSDVFNNFIPVDSCNVKDILKNDMAVSDYHVDFKGRNTKRLFGQIERFSERDRFKSELYSFIDNYSFTDNSDVITRAEQRLKNIIENVYFGVDENRLMCTEHFINDFKCFVRTSAELSVCAEKMSELFGFRFDIDAFLIDGIIKRVISYLTTNYKNRALTEMYFILSFLLNNTDISIGFNNQNRENNDIYLNENGRMKNTVSLNINVKFITGLDKNKKSLLIPLIMNLLERRETYIKPKHVYRLIVEKMDYRCILKPLINGGYKENAVDLRNRSTLLPKLTLISRVGGKSDMSYGLAVLFDSISDKGTTLVTCCGGGAREFDNIDPHNYGEIVYNEKVAAICALFKAATDRRLTDTLKKELEIISSSFDESINDIYAKALELYRNTETIDALDDQQLIKLAVCGFVVCNCAYNGIEGKRGFNQEHTSDNYQKVKRKFNNKCRDLDKLHTKYCGMKIINNDIFDLLEKYLDNSKAVIYIDPPYPKGKNNDDCDYYINTVDIEKLVSLLISRKPKAKVIISGTSVNRSIYVPLVRANWSESYIKSIHVSSAYGDRIRYMDEYLWTNFRISSNILHEMSVERMCK